MLALALVGCTKHGDSAPMDTVETDVADTEVAAPPADVRVDGPIDWSSTPGTLDDGDCRVDYVVYTPASGASSTVVILSHGLAADGAAMAGWAEHYASWGLVVVVPDLCHSGVVGVDHDRNVLALHALAAELAPDGVIYAGHSFGALESVLAAADDPAAVGVLGLDLADDAGAGVDAAPGLTVPLAGLVGEAEWCNQQNNGIAVYDAAGDAVRLRVTEADHCDFEDPSPAGCGVACGGTNDTFSDDAIQTVVRGMSTAWLRERAGLADEADAWWAPGGAYYDALATSGAIAPIE
jgi:pimeloyl-ACP methyl ester carboxylesterase